MSTVEQVEVTQLLLDWSQGDQEALEKLTPLLYAELKRLAHSYMRDESREPILQTTALVHEAYLRLIGLNVSWEGRHHFVAVSAKLMRRVLVDYARRRNAEKRGSGQAAEPLDARIPASAENDSTLALHEALQALEKLDPRKHRIVELKYFGGATVAEICQILQVGQRTVERDLRLARAWLADELGSVGDPA